MDVLGSVLLAFLAIVLALVGANPSCPELKPGMTNVHIVCHTHDDVGWLKTVDQYYYGANKYVTWVGVQYILDSVVGSLLKDSKRKFIFVESAFFFRWWDEQNDQTKSTVKKLVDNGQLEFISGGWCMNDEAGAHYTAIIDQMTLGLVKLNDTFGDAAFPRIAWQIDPFGHSKEQASIFAQMGMDGLFFGRLDHDDKNHRWSTKQMEMVWKGSASLGESAWLFTGVLPNGYSPPKGFCFDLLCGDEPIMDDPRLEDYNKNEMVNKFLQAVKDQSKGYATSNLIMTMGEDFNYVYAESWYKNLDKLMKYVNGLQSNGSKVNLVYSTPSCYLDSLHASDIKWPTKSDDFFPYASDPHAYWTGYFTSRPTLKGFIRQSNNLLQAAKQASALIGFDAGIEVEKLAKAVAVAQHHDAVTGTAKQHVTDDYSKRLYEGTVEAYDGISDAIRIMTHSRNSLPGIPKISFCTQLNISACEFTEKNGEFTVFLYNPLSRPRSFYAKVPVSRPLDFEVLDEENHKLISQLLNVPKQVQNIPGRESAAKYELIFYVEDLPGFGVKQFLVRTKSRKLRRIDLKNRKFAGSSDLVISKGNLSLKFDAKSNLLKSVGFTNSKGNVQERKVNQKWLWYSGERGNNTKFQFRASGAYIFRPDGQAKPFDGNAKITAHYDGPLVSEVHQEWNSWISQIIRLHKHNNYIDIQWLVGPIPITDGVGKEIVNRVTWEEMESDKTFFTDANGREMQKRVRDFRETWTLKPSEPVSQNYYPVTAMLNVHSTNGKGNASFLNDRAQGGSSLGDGEMELMVHRRLLDDDAFGVGEPLNETAFGTGLVARGNHYLVHSDFGTNDCDFGCQYRSLAEEIFLQPIMTFASTSAFSPNMYKSKMMKSALGNLLPLNVRILTLEPWKQKKWLLRLENFYECCESIRSGTSRVNIKQLFANRNISEIEELTLGANRYKKDDRRLKWKTTDDEITTENAEFEAKVEGEGVDEYSFSPMQIRSFLISFNS